MLTAIRIIIQHYRRIFFLELLSDKRYECIIRWLKADGTFEIVDPEELAILWGQRKFNKTMNYSKLSRSLRTYNKNKNKICKVNGMKRVYKFTCDLKQYFGYDAQQLFNMAN